MPYIDPFSPYSPFSRPPRLPWGDTPQDPAWRDAMSAGQSLFGPTASIIADMLLGTGGGTLAFLGPIGAALPHIIHDLTGQDRAYEAAQEYRRNVMQYKIDLPQREMGARQLTGLAGLHTPEDIKTSAEWAALGLMGNPEQEADHIAHRHVWTSGHPELVEGFMQKAPELKEENWQAYLDTMDAAAKRNLDMTPVGYVAKERPEDWQSQQFGEGIVSAFEAPHFEAPRHAFNVMDPNAAISAAEAYYHLPDQHGAAGSLADIATGATTYGAAGNVFSPEELRSMGFTPGHYQEAMRKYLLGRDPSLASNPDFGRIFDPTVEAPADLTADQITSNDAAFQQQIDAWGENLRKQRELWDQNWQRYAAEAQQRWTSGGS